MASILEKREEWDRAMAYRMQDLKICQEIGDANGMGITLSNIAQVFVQRGKLEESVPFAMHAYHVFQQIELKHRAQSIAGLLEYLIEQLGEETFQRIVKQMNDA